MQELTEQELLERVNRTQEKFVCCFFVYTIVRDMQSDGADVRHHYDYAAFLTASKEQY